jgi:hypothetical protein
MTFSDIAHECLNCGRWHLSRPEWLVPTWARRMTHASATRPLKPKGGAILRASILLDKWLTRAPSVFRDVSEIQISLSPLHLPAGSYGPISPLLTRTSVTLSFALSVIIT